MTKETTLALNFNPAIAGSRYVHQPDFGVRKLDGVSMRDDVKLFQNGSDTCWAAKFLACMARLRLTHGNALSELRAMDLDTLCAMKFGEAKIPKAFEEIYDTLRGTQVNNPRSAPNKGVAWAKNSAWFSSEDNKHLEIAAPTKHVASLMRFRLGCCLDLRVYDHTIPIRQNRFCTACCTMVNGLVTSGRKLIDDEYHMIFECVRYNRLRSSDRWASLYNGGQDMKGFMNQAAQGRVADYIHLLLEMKRDPHPVNQVVDMFDSSSTGSDYDDVLEP